MKDTSVKFTYDLANLDRAAWMLRVGDIAEDFGNAEPIGPDHTALFIDAGRTLIVGFETRSTVGSYNDTAAPLGWDFVRSHGWSSLTLLANTETDWFRHPAIFAYFDRLIDDGFFDDFDRVLFYGAGAAGYAAAAYSVAAPGAVVLAMQPQATLAASVARWDRRFPQARRLDFHTRYGYAPRMVQTASRVYVFHDPSYGEDAMHAALFNGANTTHLTCPYVGPHVDQALASLDVINDVIEQAMTGELDRLSFAKLWRGRHNNTAYLRKLLYRLEGDARHQRLLARLCRSVLKTSNKPRFARKLAELAEKGIVP